MYIHYYACDMLYYMLYACMYVHMLYTVYLYARDRWFVHSVLLFSALMFVKHGSYLILGDLQRLIINTYYYSVGGTCITKWGA